MIDVNSIKNGISTVAKKLKYDITNIDDQYKEMTFREEECTFEYIKAWLNNFEKEGEQNGSEV